MNQLSTTEAASGTNPIVRRMVAHLKEFWITLKRDIDRPYRPELYYMRGPGPAWRKKHKKK